MKANLLRRLEALEHDTRRPVMVVAILPADTGDAALDRHYAAHPEDRGAAAALTVFIQRFAEATI
jgi:hypothetical protein